MGSLQSVDDLVVGTPGADTDEHADAGAEAEVDADAAAYALYLSGLQPPHFIFHAAGHCAKLEALRGALHV